MQMLYDSESFVVVHVHPNEDDVPAAVPVEDRSGRKETQLANGDPQSPADEGELSRDSHQLDRAGRLDIRRQQ